MQKRSGQTSPQTPPRGLLRMISPAARRKSAGLPPRPAMMKSNGEQFAGHAAVHGFSSQYSQRRSSVWRRWVVMNGDAGTGSAFIRYLACKQCSGQLLCRKAQNHYSIRRRASECIKSESVAWYVTLSECCTRMQSRSWPLAAWKSSAEVKFAPSDSCGGRIRRGLLGRSMECQTPFAAAA